jgi:GT2 family glycosyltransferase
MPTAAGQAPLVSVITIFLDAGRFFAEAVHSVLQQTYSPWELLLVDDGSTDGTSQMARDYAGRHPDRIRYLEHPGHARRGMSASRNVGLRHARGAFIGFLDADDVWRADKLERLVPLLAATREAAAVSGPTRLWYGWTGRPEDARRDAPRIVSEPVERVYQPPELLRRFLTDRALTPATCSILLRREVFERIGGFEERFTGLYEDQAFFLKAYLKLPIYLTGACTDLYRQHPGSHSAEAERAGRFSAHEPSPALLDLLLWLTRYLLREGTVDPVVWTGLLRKLARIAVHRAVTGLNRPAKGVLAWWYRVKRSGAASDETDDRR